MDRKYKKLVIVVVILIVSVIVLTFVANSIIERKIETAFSNLPESIEIEYTSLDVAVWSGKIQLHDPKIVFTGQTTSKTLLNAKLKKIEINDLGYWNLLVNDKISVGNLDINGLVVKYLHNPLVKEDDNNNDFLDKIKQVINVRKFSVNNADILIADFETDSTLLSIPKFNFQLSDLQIDPNVSEENKAITYGNFILNTEHLKWAASSYENVFLDAIHITNTELKINGLKLKTKYNKVEFSNLLKIERDHFNLEIKEVKVLDMDFGFNAADKFYFKSQEVDLDSPNLQIYRDKLVADDLVRKALYSKMLRDLNFDLTLKDILIKNGTIIYSEKVNADMPAGEISFTKMNADIKNVSNTYGSSDKTSLDIDAIFMAKTPIKVNWNFDVNNVNDAFVFKADIGKLPAPDLNPFSKPNLKVEFEGELLRTYATISGNANTSMINMRANYEEFRVNVLDKKGEHKNKVLSTIANLFIKKDSNKTFDGYREGSKEGIERDHTKSVFNFLWMSMRSGLISVLTGDGKK